MGLQRVLIAALLAATTSAAATAQVCNSFSRQVSNDADPLNFRVIGMGWNGSFIGVAKLRTGASGEIDFALYDSELNQTSSDSVVAPGSLPNLVAVGSNGDGFGLIYQDALHHLQFQPIASDGRANGSAVALFAGQTNSNELSKLLWNGHAWIFARTTDSSRTVWLDEIDTSGNLIYERAMPAESDIPSTPDIAIDGPVTDVLWRGVDSTATSHLFVVVTDTSQPNQVLPISILSGLAPLSAWDGENFDTIVKDESNPELDWFQTDFQRDVVTEPSPLVTASEMDISAGSLASSGGILLLQYVDSGDAHVLRFLPDGTVLSDVDESFDFSLPTFALTSRMVVLDDSLSTVTAVARKNPGNGGWDSYLIKLCPLSVLIDVPRVWPVGQPVTLSAQPSGGIAPYNEAWDFGDGLHASGTTVTHTFTASRTFDVKIHVTDLYGTTADVLATITVGNLPPLSVDFTNSSPVIVHRETTFNAVASGGVDPLVVSWSFGDGTTGEGESVTHTYAATGPYTVTSTVTDRTGGSASIQRQIVVSPLRSHAIQKP